MSYKNGDVVEVFIFDEWCIGIVMAEKQGHVMAHIDRPTPLSPLVPGMIPNKPIVMVKLGQVRPVDDEEDVA